MPRAWFRALCDEFGSQVTVHVARADGAEQRIETLIATTERATTATVVGCTALED